MRRTVLLALLGAMAVVAPRAAAQSTLTPAEGRRGDLAVFREQFFSVDQSYSPGARAEAERQLAQLEQAAGELTPARFELELARIVALADNGHTNSPAARRSRRYARVPVRFVPFGTDFYVLRADSANADLLGARLLGIDRHPIADVRQAAHALWGGTPGYRDRQVPFLLESPDQLLALGLAASGGKATYGFALRDGRRIEREIVADPANPTRERHGTVRWLYFGPLASDRGDWRMLGSPDLPWAFHEPDQPFRWRHAPELGAILVQLRANRDSEGHSIATFLGEVTEAIRKSPPQHAILDLRGNGGGDLNTTRDFVQGLPGLVPGRIFVLTSPWTFSAAISTTGYLKQAGGPRVTIVGEMVGDRLEFWAEGGWVQLPYSEAAMSIAVERHDYRTGCQPYKDCHAPLVRHPIRVPTLAPDIEAPLTIDAFMANRDPGMDAVAAALKSGK